MIKALFFDLDGTLLNKEKKICEDNLNALQECRNKGVKLYIATARPPSLKKTLDLSEEILNLFDGGIYCNGACIIAGERVHYTFLLPQTALQVIKALDSYPEINMAWQLPDNKHAFRHPLKAEFRQSWGVKSEEILLIDESLAQQVVKALIFYDNFIDAVDTIPTKLVDCLKGDCLDDANIYLTDEGKLLQIVNISINKERGIETVRQKLGLKKEEIAVFGDDVNDVEMLSAYPNSIAMGNAKDDIKNVAAHVTLGHDEKGIAHALKYILKLC